MQIMGGDVVGLWGFRTQLGPLSSRWVDGVVAAGEREMGAMCKDLVVRFRVREVRLQARLIFIQLDEVRGNSIKMKRLQEPPPRRSTCVYHLLASGVEKGDGGDNTQQCAGDIYYAAFGRVLPLP